MRLTEKLIGYLYRAFDKKPDPFVAMRLRYDGDGMRWSVSDGVLTTTVTGGNGQSLTVELDGMTLHELAGYFSSQDGYVVVDLTEQRDLSALVLLDGSGDQNASNGDRLFGYSSTLYALIESVARELIEAKTQITNMLAQLSIKTAESEWLDEWGEYFGIPREDGELDADYANRIIIEVIRPRGNNKAIELALFDKFWQVSSVVDVVRWTGSTQLYDGDDLHNGLIYYDAPATPVYGLFYVTMGYDLLSGADQSAYGAQVRAFIENLRDAGTHLDSLQLSGSGLLDSSSQDPDDTAGLVITYQRYYNGLIAYNGAATYAGTEVVAEAS